MANTARSLVEDVLSAGMTREIWSSSYYKVLPVTLQDFEISSILPVVFYMFRFGHRRGAGKFLETFGSTTGTPAQRRKSATVDRVSEKLAATEKFNDFAGEVEEAILGDLLLCFCVENVRRNLGRDQQVQRVAPAHYLASWIDLPQSAAHLRSVPEMLVAMLANRREGDHVTLNEDWDKTNFPVGRRYTENVLLRAFSQGVYRRGEVLGDLASDQFDEDDDSVGLDQLLVIRLAQQLGSAPKKSRSSKAQGAEAQKISNQRPIAEEAAKHFSDDIRRFVRSYAASIPRHAFVDMIESCIAVGLSTILTSTVEVLFRWATTGAVPDRDGQRPASLFVDCSNGADRPMRTLAEQSMDDFMRRMEGVPLVLMVLRILDYEAQGRRQIRQQNIVTRPYATEWLNLLGDLLHDRHVEASRVTFAIEDKTERLADVLAEDYADAAGIMRNPDDRRHPVWRLASGLITLTGRKSRQHFMQMVDSSMLTERPNGIAVKRVTTRGVSAGQSGSRQRRDVRALVLTNSVLDYLVHLHLLPGPTGGTDANILSFIEFLRNDYGFHVDTAPPGMTISNEDLHRNRAVLERRLRDLGLLVGVNDAERMKRLTSRFETVEGT